MLDLQTRTEQMAESCLQYLDRSENAGFLIGLLLAKRNLLEGKIGDINDFELIQELNTTGTTTQKLGYKRAMCELGFTVGRKLVSWAIDTNNDALKAEANYRFFQLYNVKDSTALNRCQTIYDRAHALVTTPPLPPPVFGDYGMTSAENLLLNGAITNFTNALGLPQAAGAVKEAATEDIDHAFGELDEILIQIDHIVDTKRFTNKTFWEGWHAARKRDDTGVRHQSARIYLIDAVTLAKIGQGVVSIPALSLTKKVTKFSLATFKDAETHIGTFDFVAKADMYVDAPIPNVVIEDGKLTKVIVKMTKVV